MFLQISDIKMHMLKKKNTSFNWTLQAWEEYYMQCLFTTFCFLILSKDINKFSEWKN